MSILIGTSKMLSYLSSTIDWFDSKKVTDHLISSSTVSISSVQLFSLQNFLVSSVNTLGKLRLSSFACSQKLNPVDLKITSSQEVDITYYYSGSFGSNFCQTVATTPSSVTTTIHNNTFKISIAVIFTPHPIVNVISLSPTTLLPSTRPLIKSRLPTPFARYAMPCVHYNYYAYDISYSIIISIRFLNNLVITKNTFWFINT